MFTSLLGRLVTRDGLTIMIILVAAFSVRTAYVADVQRNPQNGFPTYFMAGGVPTSDAFAWIEFGEFLKRKTEGRHYFSARRPLYGMFLSTLYELDDNYLEVAQFANVVMGTLTCALVFGAIRPVFGWAPATAMGAWMTIDPMTLQLTIVPLSEIMGLFFTALHIYHMTRVVAGRRQDLIGAGLAIVAANLARTMSLFVVPVEIVLIGFVRWRASGSFWRAFFDAALFGLAASILLFVFLYRNYLVAGIFSISDNTASILYGATDRKYGTWSVDVEEEAIKQGIVDIKDRYRYFMEKAKHNLRTDPGFYLGNANALFWRLIEECLRSTYINGFLYLIISLLGLQTADSLFRYRDSRLYEKILMVGVGAGLAGIVFFQPDSRSIQVLYAFAAVAFLRSLYKLDGGLFIGTLWLFTILGVAAFGAWENRFHLLFDFLILMLSMSGISLTTAFLQRLVTRTPPVEPLESPIDPVSWLSRFIWVGIVALFAVWVYGQTKPKDPPKEPAPVVTDELARQMIEEVRRHLPKDIAQKLPGWSANKDESLRWLRNQEMFQKGRLLIASSTLSRFVSRMPSHFGHISQSFPMKSRVYPRSVILARDLLSPNKQYFSGYLTIDGFVPTSFGDRPVCYLAVANVPSKEGVPDAYEIVAIVPWKEDRTKLDFDQAVWASDPEHLSLIRSLLSEPVKRPEGQKIKP